MSKKPLPWNFMKYLTFPKPKPKDKK